MVLQYSYSFVKSYYPLQNYIVYEWLTIVGFELQKLSGLLFTFQNATAVNLSFTNSDSSGDPFVILSQFQVTLLQNLSFLTLELNGERSPFAYYCRV